MAPKNKKGKGNNAGNNNAKGKNGGPAARTKKQAEAEEFERVLADLSKVTEAVGRERAEQHRRDEQARRGRLERLQESKKGGIEEEFDMMLRRKYQKQHFQQLLQRLLTTQRLYLDAPNTDVNCEEITKNKHFGVAVGEMQGWRASMEDKHLVDVTFPDGAEDSEEGLFCVFDGHSGKECAERCSELFPRLARLYLARNKGSCSVINFESVFMEADMLLEQQLTDQSGCTAVSVHITPQRITCASVGDSRAVLCREGSAVALSEDHKPENTLERERIEAAGGTVSDNRVNGQLAMSRAMGDFSYKMQKNLDSREQLVIAVPDTISVERENGDAFVVLACDGIFDVLNNQELIDLICRKKAEGKTNKQICGEICHECLAPPAEGGGFATRSEGTDNMTIIIVDLN
ncbi:putative Protein phosphatase 2C [Trypanosoma vivax]|uniref:protein-serine/threonine phosphatase n=1 Tax=Trypanosoma vivax (strain Y486) TaxID=1055687 RepID=G0TVE0_TRYVY|nr:putative protein phosphatase 2C [Trypanosoma vivax]KAH8617637.1 putative Protein phosphatase 2C [Trypanosoma vivax]CCC47906.1 putative protein phosphatase 2C [Trypanosoma vivax Y486]